MSNRRELMFVFALAVSGCGYEDMVNRRTQSEEPAGQEGAFLDGEQNPAPEAPVSLTAELVPGFQKNSACYKAVALEYGDAKMFTGSYYKVASCVLIKFKWLGDAAAYPYDVNMMLHLTYPEYAASKGLYLYAGKAQAGVSEYSFYYPVTAWDRSTPRKLSFAAKAVTNYMNYATTGIGDVSSAESNAVVVDVSR